MSTKAKKILEGLSDAQKKPVIDYHGPSIVCAGPGSGKTHMTVSRAAYMINDGIDPQNILMFTFTNKAAKEIKERIMTKIGDLGEHITIGTYHSVCSRLLRKYSKALGYNKNFSIFDSEDSLKLLKGLVKGMSFDQHKAQRYISECKSKMISPTIALQNAESEYVNHLADIYQKYQQELFTQGAMDFDDLIYKMIILLENNPDIKLEINNKFHYVIADESHDSSITDLRLIELLAGDKQNICFILDDEQSIYGFRGSDIEAVLNVNNIFKGIKTFILNENYRSTKKIVKAARSLISQNKKQIPKEIFTNNNNGTPVIYFEENNQQEESLRVTKLVMSLKRKYALEYKDIAILYRMSYLSRNIEDSFLRNSIPYKIIGGTPFYARKEVKDILCYARLLNNPYDFEALKRVINTPKRGIGEKNIEKIFERARFSHDHPIDFLQACEEVTLTGKAKTGLKEFNEIIADLRIEMEDSSPPDFLDKIIRSINYIDMLYDTEESNQAEERVANLVELVGIASSFNDLEEFLQNITLNSNQEEEQDENRVQMLTMHASKGLEYKAVIIISSNEGVSPHWKAQLQKDIDEERRLFYVAMTRAEQYLFITRPKLTIQNGSPTRMVQSRFIREIDKEFIEKY